MQKCYIKLSDLMTLIIKKQIVPTVSFVVAYADSVYRCGNRAKLSGVTLLLVIYEEADKLFNDNVTSLFLTCI